MAFFKSFTLPLVVLFSLCFLSTSMLARSYNMFDIPIDVASTSTPSRSNILVEIRNELPIPGTHNPLRLRCGRESSRWPILGYPYRKILNVDEDFGCVAWKSEMSTTWFTSWDAYSSTRDKGHGTVYWLVKEEGLYHSWDGFKWKLMEKWHTK